MRNPNITILNQKFLDAVKYAKTYLELGKPQADIESKITLLLESGASINTKDENGQTALHYASAANNYATFDFLLKRGADINAKDNDGKTASDLSESRERLINTTKAEDKNVQKALHTWNIQISSLNQKFLDAVKYAKTYLELGKPQADIESKIRLLLDSGASIDTKDENGQTALHYASAANNYETVNLLLKEGADIEGKDKNGNTALLLAASKGHTATFMLLLDRGADFRTKNKDGFTPLHLAESNGHEVIVGMISKAAASSSKVEAKKPSPSAKPEKTETLAGKDNAQGKGK
jgi:ankyrin repeat protein